MRHILIWPYNHHATFFAVDAPHVEDIGSVLEIWTERLFLVNQSEAAFWRAQNGWQITKIDIPEPALQNAAHIYHSVVILTRCGMRHNRR